MAVTEAALKPFVGTWQCDNSRSEHFDDFLKEMGVNFVVRKIASKASPTMHIYTEDNNMVIKTDAGFTTRVSAFPMNGTVADDTNDSQKSKINMMMEGEKVVTIAIPADPKLGKLKTTRSIENDELIQLLDVSNGKVICKRVFKKK